MKKLILMIVLLCSFVFADECNYHVDYINDDGTFLLNQCFDNFEEAKEKMKELGDEYVVRNDKSLSPSKIVAMNSGLAYTYSFRSGTSIQNIYSNLTDTFHGTGVSTYLTAHYEMTYHDTAYVHEFKSGYTGGWVKVTMNGFTGYTDLEYVDLVPFKFIEKEIPIALGGNDKTNSAEEPFSVVCKQNYYEAVKKDNYIDLVFHFYRAWSPNERDPLHSAIHIGVAPDFMQEGVKYYSNDGINFYTDSRLQQYVGTNYNYYQFLPVRTKTNISAETINAFLNEKASATSILLGHGEDFIENQNKHGVNAITILSMAIHESGWGTSNIARKKNNLFGWGAFDDATSNATTYATVSDCIKAQMADNLANYLDVSSNLFFSMSLGNKGGGFITKYASDPYWAEKISQYYYEIDKYDNNYDGNLTDYNSVKIALVKNKTNITINNSELPLYNKNNYLKNMIISVINDDENKLTVQTPNPVEEEIVYPIQLPKGTLVDYSWDKSVGVLSYDKAERLNYSLDTPELPPAEDEKPDNEVTLEEYTKGRGYQSISNIVFEENLLKIEGASFFEKTNFNNPDNIKHKLLIKDWVTDDVVLEQDFENTEFPFSLNDGYEYKYIGFKGQVDIKEIESGNYYMVIRTIVDNQYLDQKVSTSNKKYGNLNLSYEIEGLRYSANIVANSIYSYVMELNIISTPIDYSLINKVETRNSMFAFDSLKFSQEDDEIFLNIDAHAMIYYLNYDEESDLEYSVYLVKNSNEYIEESVQNYKCSLDYSTHLNSSYSMDRICFSTKINVNDLQGEYDMVLVMRNGEYADIVNMQTSTKTFDDFVSGKTYSVQKTNVRNNVSLTVS